MDCSLPGSSIHGIFQARVLEWGAIDSHLKHTGPFSLKPAAVQKSEGESNELIWNHFKNILLNGKSKVQKTIPFMKGRKGFKKI